MTLHTKLMQNLI